MITIRRTTDWREKPQLIIRVTMPSLARIGPDLSTWYATSNCYSDWVKVRPFCRNTLAFMVGVSVDGIAFSAEKREAVEHLFFLIGVRIDEDFDDIPF